NLVKREEEKNQRPCILSQRGARGGSGDVAPQSKCPRTLTPGQHNPQAEHRGSYAG
ncbi:hypothetical protein U1Q18_007582, partial [Sarracenia purpurea var. burkii]